MRSTERVIKSRADAGNRGRKFYDMRDAIQHENEVQTLEQIAREHLMDAEARRRKLVELQIRIYNNPYLRGRRAKRG